MNEFRLFTSESVTEGHPDKLADQISDAILDAILEQDPKSRVALEALLTKDNAYIAGEVTTSAEVDYEQIARQVMYDVGYNAPGIGCDCHTWNVKTHVHQQSPHIAMGVDKGGAGDQGMMFGYASDETSQLMPLPITVAHAITRKLAEARKSKADTGFLPDGKSQVTIAYNKDGTPHHIETIVVSTQHQKGLSQTEVKERVEKYVISDIYDEFHQFIKAPVRLIVNPTGKFEIGGPEGDTGLTGRKIIVDTYGGMARHGGGSFSGKDATKVDRSGSYIARYVAKNLVAAGMAKRCEIQIAYAIGVAEPVSVSVDTFGTAAIPEEEIIDAILKNFDLTPRGIIKCLDLEKPIYRQTSWNGHFGNPNFPWERIGVL